MFNKFPIIRLYIESEIIICFLILEFNAKKAQTYLKEEKNISVSLRVINNIYAELRSIIYIYLLIVYDSVPLGERNNNSYFACNESLFGVRKGKKFRY